MNFRVGIFRKFFKCLGTTLLTLFLAVPFCSVSSIGELDSSGFVNLLDYVPDAKLDLRYYSDYNFVGKKIDGYEENIALITKEAAKALKNGRELLRYVPCVLKALENAKIENKVEEATKIAADIKEEIEKEKIESEEQKFSAIKNKIAKKTGKELTLAEIKSNFNKYTFKIFDTYRPQRAVDDFIKWSKDDDVKMKEYFYPEIEKAQAFKEGYIARKSGHSRGSTFDLTIYDLQTDVDLDMGGTFDYFGERSHYAFSGISLEQKTNRQLLHYVMECSGFNYLKTEWWHFTLRNEPYPNTYFNFTINSQNVPRKQLNAKV